MTQKPANTLYCPIRKEWVAALPEEHVRQGVLRHMLDEKGFPAALVAVEKSLRQMPHISAREIVGMPDRRADVVCFAKGIHPDCDLYPLLIVECKAVKLSDRVVNQVSGYNHFVRACFIAIVNATEIRTGWYDRQKGSYAFVNYMPSYEELISSIQR